MEKQILIKNGFEVKPDGSANLPLTETAAIGFDGERFELQGDLSHFPHPVRHNYHISDLEKFVKSAKKAANQL